MPRGMGRAAGVVLSAIAALGGSATAQATIGACDTGGPIEVEASAGNPGPTPYASLTAAFGAVNAGTHVGTITIEVCGDTEEGAATAVLNASGAGSASYASISVRPVGGAGRTITGATTAGSALIDLNGADRVTIDGVNAGGNTLTISNRTASAVSGTSTIRLVNGASFNTVTSASILGSFSGAVDVNGGTIYFATDATTADGNDSNQVSSCKLGPAGLDLPTKAIYGNGSTTTAAIGNQGILIVNNDIFDFFGPDQASAGVYVGRGNNAWGITANRLYQTAERTWFSGANHRGIEVQNTFFTNGAQGFSITGNRIGFSAATGSGTYSLTGSAGKFAGIWFAGQPGGTPTFISGNTVAGVSVTGVTSGGAVANSPFIGIMIQSGNVETNGNTIGSQSANASLVFSTTTTQTTDVFGILKSGFNGWTSNDNTVGGIHASNAAEGAFVVCGMRAQIQGNTWTAGGNSVGGTVADSIQSNAAGAQVIGIHSHVTTPNLTSNVVRNLTASGGSGAAAGASVIGILAWSTPTAGNQGTISQNTVTALENTHPFLATTVTGIHNAASLDTTRIARNAIHSLSVASLSGVIHGIDISAGTATYENNVIALGNGITTSAQINGIHETGGTSTVLFNSVYVGGSAWGGAVDTFGLSSTVATTTRSYRNNVFFNARSNDGGSTGKHYAIRVAGTGPHPAGLTSNTNVLYASGIGGSVGLFNAIDRPTLADWRTATGQDGNSISADPRYLDPTNGVPDLHIDPSLATPVEGHGFAFASVTDDHDGQTRASLTPTDIGADAGDFLGGCQPGYAGAICRPAAGPCDVVETCDGASTECPADVLVAAGAECRALTGVCDQSEQCTGSSPACPADLTAPAGVECHSATGICDAAESCDGSSTTCPPDQYVEAGTECRPSAPGADCDPAELCTGAGALCPPDLIDRNAALGDTVTVSKSGSTASISWTEAEPGPFNVYRGFRDPGMALGYNHTCFAADVAGSSTDDMDVPILGRTLYYLVSRVRLDCAESSLGTNEAGVERPNPSPCPAFLTDRDQDGVEDVLDNCPSFPNPTQLDVDQDQRGDGCDNCPDAPNPTQEPCLLP